MKYSVYTDHFRGPSRVLDLMCVCLRSVGIEGSDLWPKYLARCSPWRCLCHFWRL